MPAQRSAEPSMFQGACDVPESLAERLELCRFLADASLLPSPLRKQPANVLLIMHKAIALRIHLSVAIEHMHVIDGKVGYSAELIRALLERDGHILRFTEISDKKASAQLILRHDPKHPRLVEFTIGQAAAMRLTEKSTWKQAPDAMLVARLSTRAGSWHAPLSTIGIGNLSAMELGEDTELMIPVQATAEVVDEPREDPSEHAARLYSEALATDSPERVQTIGKNAKSAGILDIPVDGELTLQQALLRRIKSLREEAQPVEAEVVQG